MSLMVWKILSTEERKLLSRILYMPKFSKESIFEKRSVFLKYVETMTVKGKLQEIDLELVKKIFNNWDTPGIKNAKDFVVKGLITEEQIDLLFKIWKDFEVCISTFDK